MSFLVCAGSKVLLPENADPVPATLVIDKVSGKIVDIKPGVHHRDSLGLAGAVEYVDAGHLTVIPGLVEQVSFPHCQPIAHDLQQCPCSSQ